MMKKRTLIIYALFPAGNGLPEPLSTSFFLDNGVKYDENVDYIFVVNYDRFDQDPIGFKGSEKFNNTVASVDAKVYQRENTGLDFGGHSCVVDRLVKNDLINKYDYFIFLNQTITGPMFPSWYSQSREHWSTIFTKRINEVDKLVGCTINCYTLPKGKDQPADPRIGSHLIWKDFKYERDDYFEWNPHVQSCFFAMDKVGLKLSIDNGIFNYDSLLEDKKEVIREKEIKLSRIFLENGYNISSLLECSQGVDFRKGRPNGDDNIWEPWNDVYAYGYFEERPHPYETVFFKSNRGADGDGVWHPNFTSRFLRWKRLGKATYQKPKPEVKLKPEKKKK